jgi:Fe-S cluster assembly ATP-binding protein
MKSLFSVTNLTVGIPAKEILHGVSTSFQPSRVTVIMGPNGSGKSTFTQGVMGNPEYVVTGAMEFEGTDITVMTTEERARLGIFLAFQSPLAIPGVSVMNVLRAALSEKTKEGEKKVDALSLLKEVKAHAAALHIPETLLSRGVNDGFSGGERKKMEILQALVLKPKFAMFDEIDTGLDVDALKLVAEGIDTLRKNGTGVLVITHYNRILKYLTPDEIIILVDGKIAHTGGPELSREIEENGYSKYQNLDK